jgi:hypothetical protein
MAPGWPPHKSESGRAFRELLDLLREADGTFTGGDRGPLDALGVVEGYRHLTHLLSYGFDRYLEADAERPAFTSLAAPTRKILGDSVDSVYHFAALRAERAAETVQETYRQRQRGAHGQHVTRDAVGSQRSEHSGHHGAGDEK